MASFAESSRKIAAQAEPELQAGPGWQARRSTLSEALNGGPRATALAEQRAALQRKATGLPDGLKAGVEALAGVDMSDVEVSFNAPEPAQIQAHAYTQGRRILIGPGQEQHLPHEAWHAAQQKQGRVKPTLQAKGLPINDSEDLEREADVMGARAAAYSTAQGSAQDAPPAGLEHAGPAPIQRVLIVRGGDPQQASDFAILHPFRKGMKLRDGATKFRFVGYGEAARTIVLYAPAAGAYWLHNLDTGVRTPLDAHGLPVPAPKKEAPKSDSTTTKDASAPKSVVRKDDSDDESSVADSLDLTADATSGSSADAPPSEEVLAELKAIKLPVEERASRRKATGPALISVADMMAAFEKDPDDKARVRSGYALAVVEAYREEREKKGAADPARLAALQFALSAIQFPAVKSSGGFGGTLGTLQVLPDKTTGGIKIEGRPAFEKPAAALEGMVKGFHRRHIIAWHTIKRSIENMVNYVVQLQAKDSTEGSKMLHAAFERLLTAVEAGEKAAAEAAAAADTATAMDTGKTTTDAGGPPATPAATTADATAITAPAKPAKAPTKRAPDRTTLEGVVTLLLQKLNSNLHNLWPGEGYENSLINSYQYIIREWAKEAKTNADPKKWAGDKAAELQTRIKSGKKKPPATFIRIVGGFAKRLTEWTPEDGSSPTAQNQLEKFLIGGADSFEVDYPYSPNRKTFTVKHEVAGNMLRVASILLPWSEGEIAGGSKDQSMSGLVTYLEAALHTFMFPPGEGDATATSAVVSVSGKDAGGGSKSAPMVLTDASGKDVKTSAKTTSLSGAVAAADDLFVRRPVEGWSGMPNAGNTCYIASVLNLIFANPYYVREIKALRMIRGRTAEQRHLAAATESLLYALAGHGLDVYDVERYRRTLIAAGWLGGDHAQAGRQQDAAELLEFILRSTTDAFGVRVRHTYTDRASGETKTPATTPEPMLRLQGVRVSGDNGQTLEQLLGVNLDGRARAEYDNGAIRDHRYRLASLPPVLTIQVARFNYGTELGRAFKLHEKIAAGQALTIPAALSPTGRDERYNLTGFILHLGETPRGGHYVSYRRHSGEWALISDDEASHVTDQEVTAKLKDAYLVTYQRP